MEIKLFLATIWALALLQIAKSLPCIGDSCWRLSQFYSEYDDDDGLFYIREGSHNSASSNNDDNNDEDSGNENTSGFQFAFLNEQQEQQRRNYQRLSKNYQQNVGANPPGQGSYRSNQQPFNPSKPYDENQETQYKPNPGRKNRGKYKSHNQDGIEGHYQNDGDGSNGQYPYSGNQGAGGDHYQNNGDEYNEHYSGGRNQGGGDYNQNFGGSYGRYTDRESSCPNCYATGFGNGDYNKNTINIEK